MSNDNEKKYRSIIQKGDDIGTLENVIRLRHAGAETFIGKDKIPADLFFIEKLKKKRKRKSPYNQVEVRHDAIWRIIRPVVENGGYVKESMKALENHNKSPDNKDSLRKIVIPSRRVISRIIADHSKKEDE